MGLAITGEHNELSNAVRAFLDGAHARSANRELQDTRGIELPEFWSAFAELGFLGLHLPESYAGGGAGLPEAAIVAEQLGATLAPGPFVPTMAASFVIAERAVARGPSGAAAGAGEWAQHCRDRHERRGTRWRCLDR